MIKKFIVGGILAIGVVLSLLWHDIKSAHPEAIEPLNATITKIPNYTNSDVINKLNKELDDN